MKTEFPILNISPTQWVLVDGTRIPRMGEANCFVVKHGEYEIQHRSNEDDSKYCVGEDIPILAAYKKIEGVLLIPERVWEKPHIEAMAIGFAHDHAGPMNTDNELSDLATGFKAGYEAAGGYTREDVIKLLDWIAEEGLTVQYKSHENGWIWCGGEHGDTTSPNVLDRFDAQRSPSPRALEIELNEDGSIPSENDTIIYNKAIY